ncbi:MAG: hypothetical protein HY298_11400 [Verrucomicrobia bacterium]|nr:hypothetical protein [Verrucomicrobiota bacterium]
MMSLACVVPFSCGAAPANVPNYQIGETARVDVITPFKLVVIDPEATEKLKLEEARRVRIIYRFDPGAVEEAIDGLHNAFAANREKFLDKVEAEFQKRQLSVSQVDSPRFRKLVTAFQTENTSLPVNLVLARLWAQGDAGEEVLGQMAARLRGAMERYIRPVEMPPEGKLGQPMVRMFSISKDAPTPTLAEVEEQSRPVHRTNIVVLARARKDFRDGLPIYERAIGRFLETLIRTNCQVDIELTRQARAIKAEPIYSADQYEPGQTIVHRGELIDVKIKAALDQLRTQSAAKQLEKQLATASGRERWTTAVWWSGAVALLLLAGFVLWGLKRRARVSLLPVPVGPSALMQTGGPEALSQTAAQSGLMLYLAHLLRDKLVQRLFSQRTHLLAAQETATSQATEMEEQLTRIQAQMQDRFKAYEQRIAELEKELAVTEGEKRDLVRAKIVLARKEYDEERAKNRVSLN